MLWDLLFADDLAIMANPLEELQERYWRWQDNLEKWGLRVNTKKMEVLLISREGKANLQINALNEE